MIRIATLLAAVMTATPTGAQMNIFSPSLLAAEDWVGVTAVTDKPAKAFQLAHQAPSSATTQTVASERKGSRLPSVPTLAAPEPPPAGPTLRREVTVTGGIVRIGDLIENAGAVAEVAIFRAPDLGQTGSVPARRIVETVTRHQIIGLDTQGIEEVSVTRASRAITGKDIEARLVGALAGQHGLADARDLSIAFDQEPRPLHIEPDAPAEIALGRLSYDARSRRFDAMIEVLGAASARRAPLRVTGTLHETFEAAVLVRALAQGETLKASDFAIERRPKGEQAPTSVTNAEQAAGLVAKRALQAGKIIRQADLMKPELVARNETVTIVFEVPGIMLTIRGKALEAGARGDLVNVLNVQSKRTLQGTVSGPGRVTVTAASPRLAASAPPTQQRNQAE